MKNVLNTKMQTPHTYYSLLVKTTAYIVEINSPTISEVSRPLGNVRNPDTVSIAAFCIFVHYIYRRILLPCHLIYL